MRHVIAFSVEKFPTVHLRLPFLPEYASNVNTILKCLDYTRIFIIATFIKNIGS